MKNNVILKVELDNAVYNCKTAKNKAQTALQNLFKLADYPTPTTLADVTAHRLATFVAERCVAVSNTSLYNQAEKDRIVNDWIEWKIKAMPNVAAVENFVKEWQEVCPSLDGDTITTADITESLTPHFTVKVPDEAHQHNTLIDNARQAITTLRDWEKERDLKKIPLKELLHLKTEDLFQSWCNGSIKVSHDGETDSSRRWREAIYNATF